MSAPGDPSRCALTQYARMRRAPSRSTVTRNRTFCASVFDESTSSTPTMRSPSPMSSSASVEPIGVEHRVECRRNRRLHGAERYRPRRASSSRVRPRPDRTESDDAPSTGVEMVEERATGALEGLALSSRSRTASRLRSAPRCSVTSAPTSSRWSRPAVTLRGGGARVGSDAAVDEPGGRFLYLNTGKASVVVPDGAEGAARLAELASDCDVVVTDRREHLVTGGGRDGDHRGGDHAVRAQRAVRRLPRPPSRAFHAGGRGIDPAERRGLEALS